DKGVQLPLNRGSLTFRDNGCIDRTDFGWEPCRCGPFTASPFWASKCSILTLGFRPESLYQGRGFESYLHHPIATLLTYEGQNGRESESEVDRVRTSASIKRP
ncbi:MAG: hypothetical protein ACPHO8_19115, partial [Mariniblastus sp.]